LAQLTGATPLAQVTSHGLVSVHETWHEPRHSTTHVVTVLQSTVLPGPTRTPQRSTLSHV
jgi:hypothetical protein